MHVKSSTCKCRVIQDKDFPSKVMFKIETLSRKPQLIKIETNSWEEILITSLLFFQSQSNQTIIGMVRPLSNLPTTKIRRKQKCKIHSKCLLFGRKLKASYH